MEGIIQVCVCVCLSVSSPTYISIGIYISKLKNNNKYVSIGHKLNNKHDQIYYTYLQLFLPLRYFQVCNHSHKKNRIIV